MDNCNDGTFLVFFIFSKDEMKEKVSSRPIMNG